MNSEQLRDYKDAQDHLQQEKEFYSRAPDFPSSENQFKILKNPMTRVAIVLCLLFAGLRAIDLGSNPTGFFCDEASIGYNAYSILETGKDEHGRSFPVYFKAFGDYKPALYIYLTALSVKIFGLNEFATRLPSAVFMLLFQLAAYFLLARNIHPTCGLLAVLLTGIEPWVNHFAHVAFSLVSIPVILTIALYCWEIAMRESVKWLYGAVMVYALAFYTYPPARVFVVLFFLVLLYLYRKEVLTKIYTEPGHVGLASVLCLFTAVPFLWYVYREPEFLSRVEYLSIFTTPFVNLSAAYRALEGYEWLSFPELSQTTQHLLIFVWNYFTHFSPTYLFMSGDENLRFGTPRFGVLSWVSSVGLLLGVVSALFSKNRLSHVLLWWIFLAPIAGALVWENVPHSGRFIVGLPAISILGAVGLYTLGQWLHQKCEILFMLVLVWSIICAVEFSTRYFTYYHTSYSEASGGWMQYGYREMMEYIQGNFQDYHRVEIITTGLHYVPYIFALFYGQIHPSDWQANHRLPWDTVLKTQVSQTHEEDVLYMYAPPPKGPPPGLELIHAVNWEHSNNPAFGFYSYSQKTPIPFSRIP